MQQSRHCRTAQRCTCLARVVPPRHSHGLQRYADLHAVVVERPALCSHRLRERRGCAGHSHMREAEWRAANKKERGGQNVAHATAKHAEWGHRWRRQRRRRPCLLVASHDDRLSPACTGLHCSLLLPGWAAKEERADLQGGHRLGTLGGRSRRANRLSGLAIGNVSARCAEWGL